MFLPRLDREVVERDVKKLDCAVPASHYDLVLVRF
jgi:hypothetical protein